MKEMHQIDEKAYNYLMKADPKSWTRSWFPHDVECEHINSNFSESFNNMCQKMRDKPITKLATMYTQLVTGLFWRRRQEAKTWKFSDIVSKAKTLINFMSQLKGNYKLDPAEEIKMYEVTNKVTKKVFVVQIEEQTCICRQWQLRQLPCLYSVCMLYRLNPNWSKYCSKYYIVEFCKTSCSWSITPLGNIDDWDNHVFLL